MFDHPLGKEMLPNIKSELPLAQLLTIAMCPVTGYLVEELSTSFSASPPQEAVERAMRSPLSLLLSKVDKPKVLNHSSQDILSSPFTSFVALLWTHSRPFTSFLKCEALNCPQCSR